MSFMRPEVYEADYWLVETTAGTALVPCDVESDPAHLARYVEGTIEGEPVKHHGWIGRLSAPGYLDCTDWTHGETEAEVSAELERLYGDE